jgi:wyosine [tRNA(Phe)-imidazoG37] synthetase (radical SAM superfamily)
MKNICGIPFSEITVHHDYYGRNNLAAVPCCGAWLKHPYSTFSLPVIEDAKNNIDIMSTWNSKELKRFRETILNESYEYCIKESCPFWVAGKLPPVPEIAKPYIQNKTTQLDYPPILTKVCIDRTCNLSCPSCRRSRESIPNELTYPRTLSFLRSGTKNIYINGSGEVFVNRYLLKILQEFSSKDFPDIEGFQIVTNGTALSKTLWYSLSDDFKDLITDINISLDSPNENTYNKIRVGGSYQALHKNIDFLSSLRVAGKLKHLTLTCVLQKGNVSELIDFVNYAIEIKADMLFVNKIEYWGHMDKPYFDEHLGLPKDWRTKYAEVITQAVDLIKKHNIKLLSNTIKLD